jgi:hypothetical protein
MKKLQAPVAGLLLLLAVSSCKKDLNETQAPEFQETTSVSIDSDNSSSLVESGWETSSDWTAVDQPNYSVYYTTFKSSDVTSDVADNGLIRVFKADEQGNTISLPFEETKGSQRLYWYYQVNEGNIMVAVDVYGDKTNPTTSAKFKNVVFSKEAISEFETKGLNKADLLIKSYKDLSSN